MKRRVCSSDMFAVTDPSFVLKDTGGEMCISIRFCLFRQVRPRRQSHLPQTEAAQIAEVRPYFACGERFGENCGKDYIPFIFIASGSLGGNQDNTSPHFPKPPQSNKTNET
jgi:hypothetical protein